MKTQQRILLVVAGSLVEFGALVTLLARPLGVLRSFLIALAAVAVANVVYLVFIRRSTGCYSRSRRERSARCRHDGELPVIEGTLIRLQVDRLPATAAPNRYGYGHHAPEPPPPR
jgi:hypothetical protein